MCFLDQGMTELVIENEGIGWPRNFYRLCWRRILAIRRLSFEWHPIMGGKRPYPPGERGGAHNSESADSLINESHNRGVYVSTAQCQSKINGRSPNVVVPRSKLETSCRPSDNQASKSHLRRAFIILTFSWPMISVILTGRSTSLLVDSR